MKPILAPLLALILLILILGGTVEAQGTSADYQRMHSLDQLTSNKVFRVDVIPHWLPGGHHFWYRIQTGAKSHEFIFVDLQQQTREPAFDHQRVAEQLGDVTGEQIAADQLPWTELQFSPDHGSVTVRHQHKDWLITRANSQLEPAPSPDAPDTAAEPLALIRPSEDKGGDMELNFINLTSQPIRTVWIDRRGQFVPYETLAAGQRFLQHTYVGHIWLVLNESDDVLAFLEARDDLAEVKVDGKTTWNLTGDVRWRRTAPERRSSAVSPDRRQEIAVHDDQLLVVDLETDTARQLGYLGTDGGSFDDRFYWSPDSRYVVALQTLPGDERQVHLVESSPTDQLQPKLHTMTYAKPGDRIATQRPRMFDVPALQEVKLDLSLCDNPWSLSGFRWTPDAAEFRFLFNQRGHQRVRLVGVRAATGEARAIVDETSTTFIDYTNKVFTHFIEARDEMIWMSERDGWNHLYRYDGQTGKLLNQITQGRWVVRKVERVDAAKRQIWFTASGLDPDQDPYYIHHCRIDFDGANLVRLTPGDGTHRVRYSPDREYLIDAYSRVDQPTITEVRRVSDGGLVCHLERGDMTALQATGWQTTVPFTAKGRDGTTDICGVIYLPLNFDAQATAAYPVIEYIYAGPHDAFVPKRFLIHNQARALAELGFIVVQIDGMGTNHRGKAFHDVCWQNLGDAGFPDRILWLQAAAHKFPQMDLARVGIYGGSAGGQSALRALLAHGDFYKVAVADCGCHDNRMDKIWWNEQWMGWPVGPHYAEQSNVTQADKLQGQLLLIVGELDRNVDPASTLQVVNALIKADKDFDLLLVPGAGHGVGSGKYGMRRTRDFFVRHLLGVEPRRAE